MRQVTVNRQTTETQISLTLNLDGTGCYEIDTGIGFFNHLLELFAAHGSFDLSLQCRGDLLVDGHHTAEDVGIALGTAFQQALGEKRGIHRYADLVLPMDEALILIALDLSGRGYLGYEVNFTVPMIGQWDTQLLEEFLLALTRSMGLTLHVRLLAGKNAHHIAEAVLKGLGRALCRAVTIQPNMEGKIPSTKGSL